LAWTFQVATAAWLASKAVNLVSAALGRNTLQAAGERSCPPSRSREVAQCLSGGLPDAAAGTPRPPRIGPAGRLGHP